MYAPRSRAAAGATIAAPHWNFYDVYHIVTSFLCAAGSNLALACGSPLLRSSVGGLRRTDRRCAAIATPSPSQILRGRRNPRPDPSGAVATSPRYQRFPSSVGLAPIPRLRGAHMGSLRWVPLPTLPRLGLAAPPSSRNGPAGRPRPTALAPPHRGSSGCRRFALVGLSVHCGSIHTRCRSSPTAAGASLP